MKQGSSEAFKEPYRDEEDEEIKPREAVILHFPKTYEAYKNLLGGILNQEEYDSVKSTTGDSKWSPYAISMANTADITLLDETIDFYKTLCDKRSELAKERAEMGDRELLAEALRIVGDKTSLDKFLDKENYPHILKRKT